MAASKTTVTCGHCGFNDCTSTDRLDAIRIECPACGSVDWIWKDNEEEDERMTQHPHTPIDESVSFRLIRYNPRRKMRGAPAAELEISDESCSMRLWMDERDLRLNMQTYGPHEALLEALVAYKGMTEITWRRAVVNDATK